MTPPWLADRRYYRPDARHTAGLTYDDIRPTEADDRDLIRHCNAQAEPWKLAWEAGDGGQPNPYPDDEELTTCWRFARNRRRQYAVIDFLRGTVKSKRKRRRKSRWRVKVKKW